MDSCSRRSGVPAVAEADGVAHLVGAETDVCGVALEVADIGEDCAWTASSFPKVAQRFGTLVGSAINPAS